MVIMNFFTQILYMGSVAAVVIAAVLLVRLLMRRFPRKYAYVLWLIVGIRLVCPVALPSSWSLFNLRLPQQQDRFFTDIQESREADASKEADVSKEVQVSLDTWEKDSTVTKPRQETAKNVAEENDRSGMKADQRIENESTKEPDVKVKEPGSETAALSAAGMDPLDGPRDNASQRDDGSSVIQRLLPPASYIWLAGMVLLLLWNLYLTICMKQRLAKAVLYRDNIYECDSVASPFVFGLFRPRIYIPFRLGEKERDFILRHEQYHIRRRDNIIKFAAFLILTVYWFHPLVWAAYFCMIRDMEMSCDEHVLASMEEDIREEYSQALLAFAVKRRRLSTGLPAFGETDTRRRIRHVLAFRSKGKWMGILAGILVLGVALVCLTNKTSEASRERTEIAAAKINGYETRLLLGSGKKIEEETSPYDGMYGGRFVLATYRDGKKCDERELDTWEHASSDGQETLYFPEKLTLCVRDYDGDGREDDFALGQRPGGSRPEDSTAMAYSFYTVEENGSITKYNVRDDERMLEEYPDYLTVDQWGEYSPEFLTENGGLVYRSPEQGIEGLERKKARLCVKIDEERLPESELAMFRDVEQRLREIYPQQLLDAMQNSSRMVTWTEGVENYHIICESGGKETAAIRAGFKEGKLVSYSLWMEDESMEKLPRFMGEPKTNDPDGISRWMRKLSEDLHEPVQKFARAVCGRTVEEDEVWFTGDISARGGDETFADMQGGSYTVNKVYGIVETFEETGLISLRSDDPAWEEMEDQVMIGIWLPGDGAYNHTYFTGGEDMEKLQALAEKLDPEYGCTKKMEKKLRKEKAEGYVLSYKGNTWEIYRKAGCVALLYGVDEQENPEKSAVMYLPELCEQIYDICSRRLPCVDRKPSLIKDLISAELSYRNEDGTYTTQTVKKKWKLQMLERVLSTAEAMKGDSACPFGDAVLTVERRDGIKIPITWADDSCRVIRIDGRYYEYEDRYLSFSPNGIRALFDKIPWRGLAW